MPVLCPSVSKSVSESGSRGSVSISTTIISMTCHCFGKIGKAVRGARVIGSGDALHSLLGAFRHRDSSHQEHRPQQTILECGLGHVVKDESQPRSQTEYSKVGFHR